MGITADWIMCTLWEKARGAYHPLLSLLLAFCTLFSLLSFSVKPHAVTIPPTSTKELTSFKDGSFWQNAGCKKLRQGFVLPKHEVFELLTCIPDKASNCSDRCHAFSKPWTAASAVLATQRMLLSSKKPPVEMVVSCNTGVDSTCFVQMDSRPSAACSEKEQPWTNPLVRWLTSEEMAPLAL